MSLSTDYLTTKQCLKDLSEMRMIGSVLARSLALENMPFEKRICKEITSLLRRNTHNLSELILFFDGLYKYAAELNKNKSVESSALFNFLLQQFTKSDYWSVGPLKVHNGVISKFPAKKDAEIYDLMVELIRIKTELEMLMDGTLPPACSTKFNQVLFSSNDLKPEDEEEVNISLNDLTLKKYMELSAQREDRKKLRAPKACSDCPEIPALYCENCQLYRCQFCSQKYHRNFKDHKEINVSAVKNIIEKMNSKFQTVIRDEQELAILINRENPWNQRMLQHQQKLTSSSEQFRLLNQSISKDHNLSKGIHEEEISKAFHLAKGDAEEALDILKRWRSAALEILKHANVPGNPNQHLKEAKGDVGKILSETSRKELLESPFKTGNNDVHLEQLLKDRTRDRQLRQRMAFTELFTSSPKGWERSHFLIEVLDFGGDDDRPLDGNERWWEDFRLIQFKELIKAISKLGDFNFPNLIRSEELSLDCLFCGEIVIKRAMFEYACECPPCCNSCIMVNIKANLSNTNKLLSCFEECFKDDPDKAGKEHSRLYHHIELISRTKTSYEELFSKFEQLLTSKAMDDAADTFRCPNTKCGKSWIIDPEAKRRIKCPFCEQTACRKCQQKWRKEHRNVRCAVYTQWLVKHHPEEIRNPLEAVSANADYQKIKCPKCYTVFMLDRGGCLHFICNKCKFEFCGSCSKPFHKPSKNPCNTCSTSKGLHAHHPRNCPFYTRDFYRNNIDKVKNLLEEKKVTMEKVVPKNKTTNGLCEIVVTDDDNKQNKCPDQGSEDGQRFCQKHFIELLCGKLFENKNIDPADIMDARELRTICDRENVEYESDFGEEALREALQQNCPLDED